MVAFLLMVQRCIGECKQILPLAADDPKLQLRPVSADIDIGNAFSSGFPVDFACLGIERIQLLVFT